MSYTKIVLAVLISSIFLNFFIFLSQISEKFFKIKINSGLASSEIDFSKIVNLITKAEILEVILPVFFFSLIYSFLPFGGIRAGIFLGIFVFIVGALPQYFWLTQSVKLPMNYIMHTLLWQLLKAVFVFGTFGLILSS